MEPPEEPSIEDCCNSGCNPCIFEVYEKKLKIYRSINQNSNLSRERTKNGINELKYTAFLVVGTILLSESLKLIRFKSSNKNNQKIWWKPGDHFLYKYKSDTLSCTRAYTPIKLNNDKNENFDFSIIVKCYRNGIVSNYLFKLEEQAVTLWRGPYGSYEIKPNKFKRIIMIAQGTGIAPFISIIESILNNDDDMTNLILFYCCQSIYEILFREELNVYKSYWNFSYEIFLPHIPCGATLKYQEPITIRRFFDGDLNKLKPSSNDQFLICGSSNFMQCYCDLLKECLPLENIILF